MNFDIYIYIHMVKFPDVFLGEEIHIKKTHMNQHTHTHTRTNSYESYYESMTIPCSCCSYHSNISTPRRHRRIRLSRATASMEPRPSQLNDGKYEYLLNPITSYKNHSLHMFPSFFIHLRDLDHLGNNVSDQFSSCWICSRYSFARMNQDLQF